MPAKPEKQIAGRVHPRATRSPGRTAASGVVPGAASGVPARESCPEEEAPGAYAAALGVCSDELIRTMAYAALLGVPLSDLETSDEWRDRMQAEITSLGSRRDARWQQAELAKRRMARRRMTVLRQFTPSQLEIVAKARQSGLLTRLQKEPEVLMLRVSEEADSARRGAVEETKRLAVDEMLASIREMCASIREKRSANARAASGALRGVLQESEDEEEKDKASPVRGHSWVEAVVREAGQAGDTAPLGDDDTDETDRRRNKEEGSYIYHQERKKKEDLWESSGGEMGWLRGCGVGVVGSRGSGGIPAQTILSRTTLARSPVIGSTRREPRLLRHASGRGRRSTRACMTDVSGLGGPVRRHFIRRETTTSMTTRTPGSLHCNSLLPLHCAQNSGSLHRSAAAAAAAMSRSSCGSRRRRLPAARLAPPRARSQDDP